MAHEQLVAWLNSAYSTERNLEQVLEQHAKRADEFPEMQSRLTRHLEETRQHAQRVEQCLKKLGSSVSTSKSIIGDVMGKAQGVASAAFSDEIVKNALGDYASEHFEIACYTSLIAAAEELGETEVANLCRQNLQDEVAMATWLSEQIPTVTQRYLQTTASR